MKLRQIFEGLGQEVAIIFGRFNPPHKGHRAAWELAAKSPVWYVGTNESTVGPKDPLPYGIKVEAMTAIWPEVEGHIIAETSWLTLASLVYEKHGDVTLLCLTDEDWVTKTIVQYNGKEGAHGFYNFKNIKQKPTPRLSSATALRDAVSKDDREAFAAAAGVPADTPVAGKPFFDLVAEYLLPYANAPKKIAKKKVTAPVEDVIEGIMSFLKSEPPKKKWDPAKDSRVVSNKKDDEAWIKLLLDKHRRGIKLTDREWNSIQQWKLKRDMKGEDAAGVGIITKQNSTVDVNKGTPRKNLKAFRLVK